MTIRQSIAIFYAVAALGLAAINMHGVAHSDAAPAAIDGYLSGTGHPEVDDLPAYLTDADGHVAR